ncbi:trace amine-associated receptor 1-like [Acipenser ruthenus]|uniref:trace amine-associated receptor 1-like n=1 Tax=Acipenser ruthenus TaxID=7906 RepID=UPI0027417107|nr:trace amine-associated receptor 1-like [Acipenser ruthenus]
MSRSVGVRTAMYFVLVLTVLITIGGNLVVIISISHFKQLHTPNNLLVLSLATADLLLGICVLPFSMIRTVENCWYMGPVFYRYYAVCDPLRYASKISFRVAWLFIALGWVLPAIYSFGLIYTKSNDKGLEDLVAILSCIYARIFTVAKKQARMIQSMESRTHSKEDKKSRAKRSREQKAAKTLGIVMGVFLVCWVPYFTDTMIDVYINFTTPSVVFDGLIWLGYINSTFNPLIYAFFYPWFRKALKLIVTFQIFCTNSSTMQLYAE